MKFDTKKDRILPPLLAMFDEISHVNRFIGNGRHGVSFFGCYITSRSSEVAAVSQSIKRKDKANKEKGDKTKDNYVRGDIYRVALSYVMGHVLLVTASILTPTLRALGIHYKSYIRGSLIINESIPLCPIRVVNG